MALQFIWGGIGLGSVYLLESLRSADSLKVISSSAVTSSAEDFHREGPAVPSGTLSESDTRWHAAAFSEPSPEVRPKLNPETRSEPRRIRTSLRTESWTPRWVTSVQTCCLWQEWWRNRRRLQICSSLVIIFKAVNWRSRTTQFQMSCISAPSDQDDKPSAGRTALAPCSAQHDAVKRWRFPLNPEILFPWNLEPIKKRFQSKMCSGFTSSCLGRFWTSEELYRDPWKRLNEKRSQSEADWLEWNGFNGIIWDYLGLGMMFADTFRSCQNQWAPCRSS